MLIALILFATAAPSGPPPWPESLKCAAHVTAAWDIASTAGDPGEDDAFDRALYWGLAAMEAAKRDGLKAAEAEAATKAERTRLIPLIEARDPATLATLADCSARVPPLTK